MEFITLENIKQQTIIKDVVVRPLKINEDSSGVLVETLRKDWIDVYGEKRDFSMQYYSITPTGLARDEDVWHCHPTIQEDRMIVISGDIVLAVADKREDSKTKNVLNLFYMTSDSNPYMVLVPKNTLHGFMVVSKDKAILLNFPTALYNSGEEGRVSYAKASVKFPDGTPFSWEKVRKEFMSNIKDEK